MSLFPFHKKKKFVLGTEFWVDRCFSGFQYFKDITSLSSPCMVSDKYCNHSLIFSVAEKSFSLAVFRIFSLISRPPSDVPR